MRYISIDLETTGLDSENHQIIEFGAVLEDTNNILPMDALPTYHAYITHPKNQLTGDIYALNLNAGIIEKLKNRKTLEDQYNFISINHLAESFMFWLSQNGFETTLKNEGTDKEYRQAETITVAGKNFAGFDKKFLDNVPGWNKHIKIRHRIIDPATLFIDWKTDNAPPALDECKKRAGINGIVTHTAVEDSLDVIAILRTQYK